MNLERGSRLLLEEMNLVAHVETLKPLPWRQVRYPLLISSLSFDLICNTVLHACAAVGNHSPNLLGES